ncbi:hypothetical protein THAOC_07220 [Thalassiosira oceanica]|uniref:Uncharacterized protein n=1 Tax=Thalassiosira oceanica TaxID=159749 RepID=K0T2G2_THAOC|nr:hypothetical protein THAOC_07220 [Thalassiosira oceanica]|eukprot:EJK71354.1 hypothetical protein THAOC_07220 [Thalassiosira oceanica]
MYAALLSVSDLWPLYCVYFAALYLALIATSVLMAAFVSRRMVYDEWSSLDQSCRNPPAQEDEEDAADTDLEEIESLIKNGDGEEPSPGDFVNQPDLSKTCIVGLTREAYGQKTSVYVAIAMVASALCLALAQMMVCAAILDSMMITLAGKTCALGFPEESSSWEPSSWVHCSTDASMKPFSTTDAPMSLISVGTVLAASGRYFFGLRFIDFRLTVVALSVFQAAVAMGTVDLDDLIPVQYCLFSFLVASVFRFSYVMSNMAHESLGEHLEETPREVSWFVGPSPFRITAPPLSCMAKSEKIAYSSLGWSCVVMGMLYALIGISGAALSSAIRSGRIEGNDTNLLSLILLSGDENGPHLIDLVFIGLFGFSQVASVPVYCLLAKDTLINDAGLPPTPSFLMSNVVPWIIIALTYNASFFEAFVNWSGLVILGFCNFSLPLWLDLRLKEVRASAIKSISHGTMDNTDRTTRIVLTLVTASISAVIVMSTTDSLSATGFVFLMICALIQANANVQLRFYSLIALIKNSLKSFSGRFIERRDCVNK